MDRLTEGQNQEVLSREQRGAEGLNDEDHLNQTLMSHTQTTHTDGVGQSTAAVQVLKVAGSCTLI